ncbi:MAG: DUF3021 domain-containing protein [Lachnospiraceae bacterium]|nr:DUF3021 domain-containing protein [Lachnospiraceae bacterium]
MNKTFSQKVIFLSSIGFSAGMLFGVMLTAILSTANAGDGRLYVCAPGFLESIGNPILALFLEMTVSGLLGAFCTGLSAVYSIEEWSPLKATLIHYILSMTAYYCAAFFLRWLSPKNIRYCILWFFLVTAGYAMIWVIGYIADRKEISRLNKELNVWKSGKVQ